MALLVLAQQVGIPVVLDVIRGGRTVYQQDVPAVGECQDAFHIVRVQLAYLVHHAMDLEIAELAGGPFLEYVDQHDVYHGFHQDVGTVGTDVGNLFHPAGIVVVFLDAELEVERIGQDQRCPLRVILQPFAECIEVSYRFLVDICARFL